MAHALKVIYAIYQKNKMKISNFVEFFWVFFFVVVKYLDNFRVQGV